MDDKNGFMITDRDHVLRAWQNTTELVSDFQAYAREMGDDDKELADLFSSFARDEAMHASKLLDVLQAYEK